MAEKKSFKKRIAQLQDDMAGLTLRLKFQKLQGGFVGATGPEGPEGLLGLAGGDGVGGDRGSDGDQGNWGEEGLAQSGPQGPQGKQGESGPQGPQGHEGKKGSDGEPGQTGPDGKAGDVQRLYSKWTNSIVAPSASRVSRSNKVLSVNLSAGRIGVTGVSFSVTGLSTCCAFLNQRYYALSGSLSGQTNDSAGDKCVTSAGVVSAILTPVLAVPAAWLASLVAKKVFGMLTKNAGLRQKSPETTQIKS